jgi:uncharacterized protein YdaU (DUF1376 family)
MHLYRHHIGDYAAATGHLTFVEDAAYCRLLRIYYSSERALPHEIKSIQRLVSARTKEEKDAVDTILNEFFNLESDGWHNKRADEEIADFTEKAPKIAAEKENAKERQRRAREHRKEIFEQLRSNGIVPRYNATMLELVTLLNGAISQQHNANVTEPVTRDDTNNRNRNRNHNQLLKESTKEKTNAVAIAPAKHPNAIRLPTDWQLPKALGDWALDQGLTTSEVIAEGEKFKDYWIAKSGKDATKNDWPATWRNWIRNRKTPSAEQKTFYERTREAKERDADKRLVGLSSASMEDLEELGLARDGKMLGARA